VVFTDRTDIYFARQQVAERLNEAKTNLPPGVELRMGPISTGLGEVYWWSVEYSPPGEGAPVRDGEPGWQKDGSYLTPEGERLTDEFQRTVYLRTVQDWVIRPQMRTVPGVAGADAIGGYVKQYHVQPDPARLIAYGLSFSQLAAAIEANNLSRGAGYIERNGEGYVVRASGRVENLNEIEDIVVATRGAVPVRIKDVAQVALGHELRTGSASVNGREVVLGTALMLIGDNSRTVAAAADGQDQRDQPDLPSGHPRADGSEPHPAGRRHDPYRGDEPRGRRFAGHSRVVRAARQLPRRCGHGDGHPDHDAADRDGHAAGQA
jgi:heavy metal efflux system protein